MDWNEWIGVALIAFAVTMSISREIGQLTKAQEQTTKALVAIHAELARNREHTGG